MSELWIIEAPGKARTLEAILLRLGLDARVKATRGHLVSMPKSLHPLGIDSRLHDYMREPSDMELVVAIRTMAREATKVVIATDADGEGNVIAWDVAQLISDIEPNPVRVRLRGFDDDSVGEAIEAQGPVRLEDAIPGRTRAILDRMIGASFSRDGVVVGRIGTALLGLVKSGAVCPLKLHLSAPAKDGGRPWLAECNVGAPLDAEIAGRLAELELPMLDAASSHAFTAAPGHMGDIMVRAAEHLDISPGKTAKAMQNTYEAGKLSYPRSGSRGMSGAAARKLKRMLERAGTRFDESVVVDKAPEEVHDAPHPIGHVDLSLDPRKLGNDEGVRALIARDLVRTGQKHTHQHAVGARLEAYLLSRGFSGDVARHVAMLDWRREQGPRYPGQESWGRSQVVRRRQDAVLLEAAMAANLGKPSTWATHIDGFMERGLVDADFGLTSKGRSWVAGSPDALLNPAVSVAIERACERIQPALFADPQRQPWEVAAERILKVLPPELGQVLLGAIQSEPPRPRRDFRALAEPGIDLDALAAAPLLPVYAPADA